MKNFLDNALRNIREFFKNLDKKQRIRLGVLTAVVIALAVTLTVILNRKDYALLYTGLPQEEAGRVYATLREMGEDVNVAEGTGSIFVPSDRVTELRMTLLGAG
ncbi:MAG: hypothetical protein LBJ99_02085, partial [Oscillospiraceae bacterium]|nr:hypothetical protein [Oscillospiraceae bacterium]